MRSTAGLSGLYTSATAGATVSRAEKALLSAPFQVTSICRRGTTKETAKVAHISAVERAGLSTLNEGQHVDYEIVANRGKELAENLKAK